MSFFRLRERFRELRKSPRHDVQYLAQIDMGDPSSLLSVIICDMSACGARLTVGAQHNIPDEFALHFRRRCRVIRRIDGQIGVEFV